MALTKEVQELKAIVIQRAEMVAPLADDDTRTAAELRAQATTTAANTRAQATIVAKGERSLATSKRKAEAATAKAAARKAKHEKGGPSSGSGGAVASEPPTPLPVLPEDEEKKAVTCQAWIRTGSRKGQQCGQRCSVKYCGNTPQFRKHWYSRNRTDRQAQT